MKVIRHHDEIENPEPICRDAGTQYINEQSRRSIRLQQTLSHGRLRRNEESSRVLWRIVAL
jgi:hypothetical protein